MKIDKDSGEIMSEQLDEVIVVTGPRPDGSVRYSLDFTYCTSKTEPHHARDTDINYLVAKYKPDELASYLSARNADRTPQFHDFSMEPDLQSSLNIRYLLNQKFLSLPEDIRRYFGSPLEFLRFVDNPQNTEALIKLGLITKEQIQTFTNDKPNDHKPQTPAPTPPAQAP